MRAALALAVAATWLSVAAPTGGTGQEADASKRPQLWRLRRLQSATFEEKTTDKDLVRGFVTYAEPDPESRLGRLVAYVYLKWGDVDSRAKKYAKTSYSNWDGSLKMAHGRVTVVRKSFQDRKPTQQDTIRRGKQGLPESYGSYRRRMRADIEKRYVSERAKIERKVKDEDAREKRIRALKKWRDERLDRVDKTLRKTWQARKQRATPRAGSSRDALRTKKYASHVAWQSGVTGGTNDILVRIDIEYPGADTGELKAGPFTIPIAVGPVPPDHSPRQARPKPGRKAPKPADGAD